MTAFCTDWFGFAGKAEKKEDSNSTFECDYDKDPTNLYQAIENQAWVPILEFFESGKWQDNIFNSTVFASQDPIPPERQARTWVTRYKNGSGKSLPTVRWSQLPLHASLVFKAPLKVIELLVTLYPPGVRCTDDQLMLPLHLAVKFGAEDSVIRLLVENFPEGTAQKDSKGRLPFEIEGSRPDRSRIVKAFVEHRVQIEQKKHERALKRAVDEKEQEVSELKERVKDLEAQLRDSTADAARLQEELDDFRPIQQKRSSIKGMLRLENINYVPPPNKDLVPPKNNSRNGGGFSVSPAVSKDVTATEIESMDVPSQKSETSAIPPREFQSAPVVATKKSIDSDVTSKEAKTEVAPEKETEEPSVSLETATSIEEEPKNEDSTKQLETMESAATSEEKEADTTSENPENDATSATPETVANSEENVAEDAKEEKNEHADDSPKGEREETDKTTDFEPIDTPSYEEFIEVSKVKSLIELDTVTGESQSQSQSPVNSPSMAESQESKDEVAEQQKVVEDPEISTKISKSSATFVKSGKQRRGFFSKVLARKSKKGVE